MLWMRKYKTVWRVGVLVLLLVAIAGPWAFDLIHVPSQYRCSAPIVRLEGDSCGVPLRGTTVISLMAGVLVNVSIEVVTGAIGPADRAGEFVFGLFLFLVALPVFSTLLLILRGDRRRWQVFTIVAWGLAVDIGLLLGLSSYPRLFWLLWGIWLYVGVASTALILEVLTLVAVCIGGIYHGKSR